MSSVRSLLTAGFVALAFLACSAGGAQAAPNNMVALGTGANANTLYRFSGEAPGAVGAVPVSGLGGSTLVGIDYRPATLQLFGLGVAGNITTLFAIDPATGAATQVGFPATVAGISSAAVFGIGFNPTVDRLRVVTDGAGGSPTNFRINPLTGAPVIPPDTNLIFTGLPGGNAEAPEAAIAYDRDVAGGSATTLYGIVSGGDRLVTQGNVDGKPANANGGELFNVGPLGVDVTVNTGFDIDPTTGEAFMAAESASLSSIYRIDLATGAATSIGQIGDGSVDFASLTIGGPPFSPPLPSPPASTPTPVPTLQALSVAPKAFAAAGGAKAKAMTSAKKAPVGTTISYTVSIAATVTFAIERKTIGRRVGKVCKPKNRGNAASKRCPIWKTLKAGFSHAGAAGPNAFKFNGKLGGRALSPGSYKLLAQAGSSSLSTPFRIVP